MTVLCIYAVLVVFQILIRRKYATVFLHRITVEYGNTVSNTVQNTVPDGPPQSKSYKKSFVKVRKKTSVG